MMIAHRSAAQKGQNSAPMKSTTGFPPAGSVRDGWPPSYLGGCTDEGSPTVVASAGVTASIAARTAGCAAVTAGAWRAFDGFVGLDVPVTLTSTMTMITTTTRPIDPNATTEVGVGRLLTRTGRLPEGLCPDGRWPAILFPPRRRLP